MLFVASLIVSLVSFGQSVSPSDCELYPIALSQSSLLEITPGAVVENVLNGQQPGNFGWLSWSGSPSANYLSDSLEKPLSGTDYVNPRDADDSVLDVGDWVHGGPGAPNSKNIREALDYLLGVPVALPVCDRIEGQGNNAEYKVVAFANVVLLAYDLKNEDRISIQFLGYASCGAVNQAPIVDAGDDLTIFVNDTISLAGTASDDGLPVPANVTFSWTVVAAPSNGSIAFENALSPTTTATASLAGNYRLELSASDGELSSSDAVVVQVGLQNSPPAANPGLVQGMEDEAVSFLPSGSDPDGDALTFVVVEEPAYGEIRFVSPNFVYTPIEDYAGGDTFTYLADDGSLESEPALVAIEILPVNDAPTSSAGNYAMNEDASLPIILDGFDVEDDALRYIIVSGPRSGSLSGTGSKHDYTPDANFTGEDNIAYKVSDGFLESEVSTVTIGVLPLNDAPTVEDASVDLLEDESVTVQLGGADIDGDSLAFEILAGPTFGALSGTLPEVFYAPFANASGIDGIEYRAFDGELYSETKTYEFVVSPVNDPPIVGSNSFQTEEDTPLQGSIGVADIDSASVSLAVVKEPSEGLVTLDGFGFTYTPPADRTESVSFDVQANDAALNSNIATISISIIPVNDPPVANEQTFDVQEDAESIVEVEVQDADGDETRLVLLELPAHGTIAAVGNFLIYTPAANYNGSDSVVVSATDGVDSSEAVRVFFEVAPVNDLPSIVGDSYIMDEDRVLTGRLSAVDGDGDAVVFSLAAPPSFGTLNLASEGSFEFVPDAGWSGSDEFGVWLNDGTESVFVSIAILVQAINDRPVALDMALSGSVDRVLTGRFAASDSDGDPLAYAVVVQPSFGAVELHGNGMFTYTPEIGFSGTDLFSYSVFDDDETSIEAIVSIEILDECAAVIPGARLWWNGESTLDLVDGIDAEANGVSFGEGKVRQGFAFNGSSDYLSVSREQLLQRDFSSEVSIELWAKPSAIRAATMVGWRGGASFRIDDGSIWGELIDSRGYRRYVGGNVPLTVGRWTHLALTYSASSGTARLYVDGNQIVEKAIGNIQLGEDGDLLIGYPLNYGGYFPGSLDEVTLYDRELSPVEIGVIHAAGSKGKCRDAIRNSPPSVDAGMDRVLIADSADLYDGPNLGKKILINNDEWTLSESGFNNSSTAGNFARNLADWFSPKGPGSFLAYSSSFAFTGDSLRAAFEGDGHEWTVDANATLTLENLLRYDGLFLVEKAVDGQLLADYVAGGGSVYIAAGTGEVIWKNDVLERFGLGFSPSLNEFVSTIGIESQHPLLKDVESLFFYNGNNVHVLSGWEDTNETFLSFEGNQLLALYNGTPLLGRLESEILDDDLPFGSDKTIAWTAVEGPGDVYMTDPTGSSTGFSVSDYGTYIFEIRIDDGEYASTDTVTITVASPVSSNSAPMIGLPPLVSAVEGLEISIVAEVEDDGLPSGSLSFAWELVDGPATPVFGALDQKELVATFPQLGSYRLRFEASDGSVSTVAETEVAVSDVANQPPLVVAGEGFSVRPYETAKLAGAVLDDGLPRSDSFTVRWEAILGSEQDVVIDDPENAESTIRFSAPGRYVLKLTANDGELSSEDLVEVSVLDGPSIEILSPTDNTYSHAGSDIEVGSRAFDVSGSIDSVEIFVAGVSQGYARFDAGRNLWTKTVQISDTGEKSIVAIATSSSGETAESSPVSVRVIADLGDPPFVSIDNVDDGAFLKSPTRIEGSAASPILDRYTLRLYPIGESSVQESILVATGNRSIVNGDLGTLDTSQLLNGMYRLELEAIDALGRIARASTTIVVDGGMKVGNLSLAFEDLSIPVSGIPMQVVRSYDSRDTRQGDFGIGWRLALSNMRIQKNRSLGEAWLAAQEVVTVPFFGETIRYTVEAARNNLAMIRLPDDSVAVFRAVASPAYRDHTPLRDPTIVFEAMGDTLGTLEIVEDNEVWIDAFNGAVDLQSEAFAFDVFDPTLFRYTSIGGTEYIIDENLGLLSVSDRNGNTLSISESGISHSNGDSVAFLRDASGRIRRIVDPLGETLDYVYDAEGRLETFSNQENEAFTFRYENSDYSYYLTDILDPESRSVLSSEYGSDGRLAFQTDAKGNRFGFVHDIENFKETIFDRLGVKTVHTYNSDGDIVLTEVFDTTLTLVQSTAYEYDARGNESKVIDSLGNITERSFDLNDNLLSETQTVTDELGVASAATTSYAYDASSNPLGITDALGNETRFAYDASGNLETQTDALGNVTNFGYDRSGNLISMMDALGNETRFTNTTSGLPETTSVYDGSGYLVRYQFNEYDAKGRQTKVADYDIPEGSTDPSGATLYRYTVFEYDGADRQTKSTILDSQSAILSSTETVYDTRGQVVTQTDALGRVTAFEYDPNGNRTKSSLFTIQNSLLRTESWTYDSEGRQVSHTDPLGRLTRFDYDALGRQVSVRFIGELDGAGDDLDPSDNTQTDTLYDELGRVTATVDEGDNITLFEYDENCGCSGRRSKTIDALLNETVFSYDLNGNQIAAVDANGHITIFEYDALNRPIKTIFHDGTFSETIYNALGRRAATIDQEGHRTDYFYDALGRLIEVLQPAPSTQHPRPSTHYQYDSRGNQITQTDAEGRTTRYEYDELGRRTKRILPEGEEESYQYDALGNLIAKVDFAGYTTTFDYDAMNRLESETADPTHPSLNLEHAPSRIEHRYDVLGNRLQSAIFNSQSSIIHTVDMAYDERNRLDTKTVPEGTLQYSYGSAGNLLQSAISNPQSSITRSVGMTYDALNRLATVNDNRKPFALSLTSYDYDAVGNLEAVDYGNNLSHRYTYDALNRLTNLVVETPNIGVHSSYAYTLGDAGIRTQVVESTGRTTNYAYDNLYRLTEEAISLDPQGINGTTRYGYDKVGNRQSRTSTVPGLPAQTFAYSDNDHLTTDDYDANGNTVQSSIFIEQFGTDEVVTDVYDFRNRLIRRTKADGSIVDLSYDASGNRVGKTIRDPSFAILNSTEYLVDENNHTGYAQVVESTIVNSQSAITQRVYYTYGHDLISQDRLNPITQNLEPSYYLYDGHGTVRQLADEFGTVTDSYTYDAFGILLNANGQTQNDYRYTGEQYDSDLGMYFLRARYLNTQTGRFHTMDSYEGRNGDPLTLHKYLYAHGNPVLGLDPSGNLTLVGLAQGNYARAVLHSMATFRTAFLVNVGIQARTVSIAAPLIRELQHLSSQLVWINPIGAGKINGMIDTLRDMINPQDSLFKTLALSSYAGFAASLPPPFNLIGWIPMVVNSGKQAALVYYINAIAYASIGFESDDLSLRTEIDFHSISSILSMVSGFRNPANDIAPASSAIRDLRSGSFRSAGSNLKQLGLNLSHYGHIGVHALSTNGTASIIGGSGRVTYAATGVFNQ